MGLASASALKLCVCVCARTGASDRKWSGSAEEGPTSQHHPVNRGGWNTQSAVSGYGARQGALSSSSTVSSFHSFLPITIFMPPPPSGWRPIWRHHIVHKVQRAGCQCHGVQLGWSHQIPAPNEHRPPRHQTREPAGAYTQTHTYKKIYRYLPNKRNITAPKLGVGF